MFAEDLTAYFDTTGGFAQQATLGGVGVAGILDSSPATFDVLAGNAPRFVLPSSSVPADPRGQVLVVAIVSYTVRDFTHDGTGLCTLQLEAV